MQPPSKSIHRDSLLLAECLVCPHTGQGLRSVADAGLVTLAGPTGFFPVRNKTAILSARAAVGGGGWMADDASQVAARWIADAMRAAGGLQADATVAELMPVHFSLAGEFARAGVRAVGVLCQTDPDAPSGLPSAVVTEFARMPLRPGIWDEILMLDPRLWRTGVANLLAEAGRLLKPGGRLWMLAPVKGGPVDAWSAQFRGIGSVPGVVRRKVERDLASAGVSAAAGAARWLGAAARRVRSRKDTLAQTDFDSAAASAGLGAARAVLPQIGLVSLKKTACAGGAGSAGSSSPVNFREPDSSDEAIARDTRYAIQVFTSYIQPLPGGVEALRGKTVVELGPGNNLATCLCMAAFGAKPYAVDRFSVPWSDAYHSKLYASVRDELLRQFPSASAAPFDLCLEFRRHTPPAVWQLPCPAEAMMLPDASVDLTMSCAVLEHVYDAALASLELARVTRAGGYAIHQVDFRDHRDFSRPLEYLLLGRAEFSKLFDSCHAECGNRIRPKELSTFFQKAGFAIEQITGNWHPEPEYFAGFLPRLRAAKESEYCDIAEEDLRDISAFCVAQRLPAPAEYDGEPRVLPVLEWNRDLSERFWRDIAGTDYMIAKAFSRICGDDLLDLLGNVLRPDWKYVDFGSGANGFIVEKMLRRGFPCASFEPSRTAASRPYLFKDHPLYLGEASSGREQTFDCVLCTEVIEHVMDEDFPGFMRRIRALLKPGGIAVFSTPNRENLKGASVFCPVSGKLFHPWQHLRAWNPETIGAFLEGYRFAPLGIHQADFGPIYPEMEKRRIAAGMLGWVLANRTSLPESEREEAFRQIQAIGNNEVALGMPAVPVRGRETLGQATNLVAIAQMKEPA